MPYWIKIGIWQNTGNINNLASDQTSNFDRQTWRELPSWQQTSRNLAEELSPSMATTPPRCGFSVTTQIFIGPFCYLFLYREELLLLYWKEKLFSLFISLSPPTFLFHIITIKDNHILTAFSTRFAILPKINQFYKSVYIIFSGHFDIET